MFKRFCVYGDFWYIIKGLIFIFELMWGRNRERVRGNSIDILNFLEGKIEGIVIIRIIFVNLLEKERLWFNILVDWGL